MASSTTSELRIGDAERDAAAERLRGHAAAGRLTVEELDERLGRALAARTRADLAVVEHDLPRPRRRDPSLRPHVTSYVLVMAGLVALWALSGFGYFWPIWPMLGWGIGVVSHARGGGYACRARSTASRDRAPSRTMDQLPSRS
jgi:hypothetical protein